MPDDYGIEYGDDLGDEFGARRRRRARKGKGSSLAAKRRARLAALAKKRSLTNATRPTSTMATAVLTFSADGSDTMSLTSQGNSRIKSMRSIVAAAGGATGMEVTLTSLTVGKDTVVGVEGNPTLSYYSAANFVPAQLRNRIIRPGIQIQADVACNGLPGGGTVSCQLVFDAVDLDAKPLSV